MCDVGDGLAAFGDDGDDMMMALARKIVSGDDETVEEVFARARDAEATAEELLVDDGWKMVESLPRAGHGVEPEAIAVDDNGNGHHTNGIGPTVELVLSDGHHANRNDHAPVPVNGNGHHDEAEEPQQALFSQAEFMAKPVKAKRESRKAQAPSLSLFRWAAEGSGRPSRSARDARPTRKRGGRVCRPFAFQSDR